MKPTNIAPSSAAKILPLAAMAGMVFLAPVNSQRTEERREPGSVFAAHLEEMLANMRETEYQAQTEIDEEAGSLRCDCSGLMCQVLRHKFPEAYISLKGKEAPWRKRPLSVTFHETFIAAGEDTSGSGAWQRVRKMMDVRPGDVLAWRKASIERGISTGHTCMIASLPEVERDGRIRVRVIDSTRKTHANDTRPKGKTGVGAGEMWFTLNDDHEPTGFYVNDDSGHSTSHKIAIGRIVKAGGKPGSVEVSTKAPESKDSDFIGLRKSAATRLAEKRAIEWRIIDEDGEIYPVKMGLSEDRVNFVIESGKVVRATRG